MTNLLIDVLHTAIYIQPVYFFLSIITNILNIRVLCSRVLRASPCTHYFLAYAIFSITYTCVLCPTLFLRGLSINWANGMVGCKIQFYILYVIPFQANLMLIFASFDRYCSSSESHQIHSMSTVKTAKLMIIAGTLLPTLYMIPMLVFYQWNASTSICSTPSTTLINIYVFSQVILYYIAAPILLIIFGFLTISNIHRQMARIIPLPANKRARRTERQLTLMLIFQVSVHLVLALPYGIVYCMNSFDLSTQTITILGIRFVFVMWQQCDYFVSFFLYILSGKVYRRQFIRLLKSVKFPQS